MSDKSEIKELLENQTHLSTRRLNIILVEELTKDFIVWEKEVGQDAFWQTPRPERLIRFLLFTVEEELQKILNLRTRHAEFHKRYTGATTSREIKAHILNFAKSLGASSNQLRKDAKAFSRWFGADAVSDRFRKQVALKEMKIGFCLERLSAVAVNTISTLETGDGYQKLISRIGIEKTVMNLLEYDGDNRVRISAFQCLAGILKLIPDEFQKGSIVESTLKYVFQAALDHRQHVWIQCEALQLLESISLSSLQIALEKRLTNPLPGDDLFVRSRAVKILANNLKQMPVLSELLTIVAKDPSPYVRKTMVRTLETIDHESLCYWMSQLAIKDTNPQVRSSVLLNITHLINRTDLFSFLENLLVQSLREETDSFALRVGLKVAADCTRQLIKNHQFDLAEKWFQEIRVQIQYLHYSAENYSVRRWAAQAHEQMWSCINADARKLHEQLMPLIKALKPGKKKRFSRSLFKSHDKDMVCRVLSVLSQEDFHFEIKVGIFGIYLRKNHCFDFHLWRMLHELRNPAPDKRQAFPHTVGRVFSGDLHIPSTIMSELTSTKVPGEPVFMPEESGWRPYLPLVDEITSLIDKSIFKKRSIQIFTHEGITEIVSPGFILHRLWAKFQLLFGFSRFAQLRNWEESHQLPVSSYIQELRKLGFGIIFKEHTDNQYSLPVDPTVKRFFYERDS